MSKTHLIISLFMLCVAGTAYSYEIVKIEETWELTVGEPNVSRNAPQVTMVMSPTWNVEGEFFVFSLNHKTEPAYSAGGMQVCLYDGESLEDHRNGPSHGTISNTSEIVTWTQSMSIENGQIVFEVTGGTSSTWGDFGGQGYLQKSIQSTATNLNTYRPKISVDESEIGFAGNRVVSLTLRKIKWTMADGQVYQLNAPIDVESSLDPWND